MFHPPIHPDSSSELTSSQNNDNTGTLDAVKEGILDLLVTKQWAIKLATEAARTVLSVDQIIVARQAGGPKPPGPNPVSFPRVHPFLTDSKTCC